MNSYAARMHPAANACQCNIGVGMTTGLLLYPVLKLITGRVREVPPPLWRLSGMSLVFHLVSLYR